MNGAWKIWAPHARQLEVVVRGRPRACEPLGDGYFRADTPLADADYELRVDGRVRPDPCSRYQPQGVHAASRWLADEYAWHDEQFRSQPLAPVADWKHNTNGRQREGWRIRPGGPLAPWPDHQQQGIAECRTAQAIEQRERRARIAKRLHA